MELVQHSIPFCFNYVDAFQADDLFVSALVYNVTSGSAVFVEEIPMEHTSNGVYTAVFEGIAGATYLIISAVYTDDTYTTVDTNYAPESMEYQSLTGEITYFAFDYTDYDRDDELFVRATVYDVTTGTPVLLSNINMAHVALGCYFGAFSGTLGHTYVTSKMVYTDGTYTTPVADRAAGSDTFQAAIAGGVFVNNVVRAATLTGQSLNGVLKERVT